MKPADQTFIDLFCGCGGFTLGMLRAGFRCVAAIDFDARAIETLATNLVDVRHPEFLPPDHALELDLTKFSPRKLAALTGIGAVDVIVGGPPCQGFSTARQRDGSNHGTKRFRKDVRRHLYRRFLDYVEFFQPRVFVIENVLGLRSAAGGRYFTAVQHEARALGRKEGRLGYRVHAQVENAPELGVPQKRRRQFIVGVRNDLPGYFPSELTPAKRAFLDVNLGDAICDLPPLAAGEGKNECDCDLDRRGRFLNGRRGATRRRFLFAVLEAGRAGKLTNHVARPHSVRDLGDFARLPEGKSSAELMRLGVKFDFPYDKSTFKDRYTRQHRNKPCSTIVAHLSKDGLMFIHPMQNRSLTPREAARVQTFPDWFVFPEARTHAFRLVGNAVPPLVAESVGHAILDFFASSAAIVVSQSSPGADASADSSVPRTIHEASAWLKRLVESDARQLRRLPEATFLFGWHALLWLFPGLHPDNALDHGEKIVTASSPLPELPCLTRRFARSGWPVALERVGREAWRRHDAGKITEEAFYCVAAQAAGLRNQR